MGAASRVNLKFDLSHPRHDRGYRRGKIKFESITQIRDGFFFSMSLRCYINIETLSNEPLSLLPDDKTHVFFHLFHPRVLFYNTSKPQGDHSIEQKTENGNRRAKPRHAQLERAAAGHAKVRGNRCRLPNCCGYFIIKN